MTLSRFSSLAIFFNHSDVSQEDWVAKTIFSSTRPHLPLFLLILPPCFIQIIYRPLEDVSCHFRLFYRSISPSLTLRRFQVDVLMFNSILYSLFFPHRCYAESPLSFPALILTLLSLLVRTEQMRSHSTRSLSLTVVRSLAV